MLKNEKWHRHLGVYGVCWNESNELLLVKKNGGPYDGRYDLPGGSLENPESLVEGLKRELFEETGYDIEVNGSIGTYDFLTDNKYNGFNFTHHIAIMYQISVLRRVEKQRPSYVLNREILEENDSLGFEWVDINDIDENNASPLVMKAIEIFNRSVSYSLSFFWMNN